MTIEIPKLPTSSAYIAEIRKIMAQMSQQSLTGHTLTVNVVALVEMARAAREKLIEEKKDNSDIDDIMAAIGALQIKAFQ